MEQAIQQVQALADILRSALHAFKALLSAYIRVCCHLS